MQMGLLKVGQLVTLDSPYGYHNVGYSTIENGHGGTVIGFDERTQQPIVAWNRRDHETYVPAHWLAIVE